MKSKADLIRTHLAGLRVLDVGGSGYGQTNAYEQELQDAWSGCRRRTTVDCAAGSDIQVDFNSLPLPVLPGEYDVAVAFDVLEHLEHPATVLRWIPTRRLLATLPNAGSWFARRMEAENKSKHLYSFLPYTAMILMGEGGWQVDLLEFQFGKWSLLARAINVLGSLWPAAVGTGIVLHCTRTSDRTPQWRLR